MTTATYGPTPPNLIPLHDGSHYPTSQDGGTLKTFDATTMATAVFSDAVAHNLAVVEILPDRCLEVDVCIEAYDPAGSGRLASGSARLQIARIGAAVPSIVGTPVMLTYTPNVAPWTAPTVVGDLIVIGLTVGVEVLGLAGIPIRWRATVKVIGAQAQQVT